MRLAFVFVMLSACWTTTPRPEPAPREPVLRPEPATPLEVTLAVGRMSFVMDSPEGQREKAEAAVRGSDLAGRLTALGYHVEVVFDEAAGDDVIASTRDGAELGRIELFELTRGRGGDPIVEAARRHAKR